MLFDVILVLILGAFVALGICKGFSKLVVKFGVLIPSVVVARFLGGILGAGLFPSIFSYDSFIARRLSYADIQDVNATLATILGTLLVFLVVFIVLKILVKIVGKNFNDDGETSVLDRVFGGIWGVVTALCVISLLAIIANLVAMATVLIGPNSTIYTVMEDTTIFKYFF